MKRGLTIISFLLRFSYNEDMVQVRNFSDSLDSHLERLNAHIETEREKPSSELSSSHEIVKRSLEKYAEQVAPLQNVSVQQTQYSVPVSQATPISAGSGSLPNYFFDSEIAAGIKEEVSKLVESAFSEGLEKAITESRKHTAFVQDAFHDALVDKLMPELKKRGMIR